MARVVVDLNKHDSLEVRNKAEGQLLTIFLDKDNKIKARFKDGVKEWKS